MKTRIFAALLAFALLLCSVGCDAPIGNGEGETGGTGNGAEEGADAQTSADTAPDYAEDVSEMFTERDGDASYDGADVRIALLGDTATATSDAVRIDGARVTVTAEATYYVTGTLNSGQIIVDASESAKVRIILDGVTVTSDASAALYARECDKLFVTLAENSENILASGSTFTPIDENDVDAAVFSKSDLTLNGTGSLFVSSPAGHGIVCKDDLVFTGGSYQITAASHGIDANDSVRIRDVQLSVTAGKDALHAENNDDASLGFVYIASGTFDLSAAGDGVSAGAHLQIENGAFTVTAGGGTANAGGFGSSSASADTSAKALKGQTGVRIANGTFTLDSADDAVHSNGSVTVSGGEFDIIKSYEGLEGLHVAITGGKIRLVARDDGVNAAGGKDGSGMG
ncbi:MAG: carbohydrate-binding domain-containing protein, partial [Clostridia bacterium]|nr:carbohydrate-binding domain-containing protein [Clostridia bacterium]